MQKINKINQYLLENYPSIWNTRLVWMLLLGIAIHIIFFFIGFVSHGSPSTLQHTRAIDDYFSTGLVFVHIIISVLLIVGWLIFMFKNNAFKNFYPGSRNKLFLEFLQYFIIVFVSTTFYFSYMTGFRLFINYKYDDETMAKNVDIINRSVPFLSQNIEDYTLENRLSPKPFVDFYCETDINKIDKTKKYFVYHDRVYQYFRLYPKTVKQTDERGQFIYPEEEKKNKTALAYFENNNDDKSRTYYFKQQVEDLSQYIKTAAPSYYNYSAVFYDNANNPSTDIRKYRYENDINNLNNKEIYKQKQIVINRETIRILEKKSSKELEKLMEDFLAVSRDFDIANNLNARDWSAMVYHPDTFEVRSFIKLYQTKPNEIYDPNKAPEGRYGDYTKTVVVDSAAVSSDNYLNENGEIMQDTISARDFNPNLDREVSPKDYFKNNISGFYYYTSDLETFLGNVDTIKTDDFFWDAVHLYIWIAFALSVFIFSFRVTDLRSLLFSVISAGVIILAVTLFCVAVAFTFGFKGTFFILYTILVVGLLILLMPFITAGRFPKVVSSVFMIISMMAFPLFIWLIFGIVNEHQVAGCRSQVYVSDTYLNCRGVLDDFGLKISYAMIMFTFVFLYLYTGFIRKWKALPE